MISMVPNTARPMRQVRPTTLPLAVADGRDAMERPLDARAVVVAERADAGDDVLQVVLGDLALEQHALAARAEAGLGPAAEVHHDLDDVEHVGQRADGVADLRRQGLQQRLHVVGGLASVQFSHGSSMSGGSCRGQSARRRRQQRRLGHADERLLQQQ